MIAPHTSRQRWLRLIPDWLCGAFLLAIPALYNGYPLVTSDSGAYITNGYQLHVPLDRPLGYSVFVRLSSLSVSMWGVVLAQALIVSLFLLIIARFLLGVSYKLSLFAGIMLLMGVGTSAGWFTSQIMPDIFTSILILGTCILCILTLSRSAKWVLYVLIFGCILMHNSNMLIALLVGILTLVFERYNKSARLRSTAIVLLTSGALAWITLSSMNAIAGHGFRPSAASHVFIMSRMVENGIADAYLDEHCPMDSNIYKLCGYRGKLPDRQWDFMWGDSTSPLYATGGWQANEAEYNHIILKTLTTPKYLLMNIFKNAEATLRQLPLIYVGDGMDQFGPKSSPYNSVEAHYGTELKEFRSCQQQTGQLRTSAWNTVITIFSLLSCLVALFIRPKLAIMPNSALPSFQAITIIVLLFLLINAAVTATFATVVARYESRVFWILPFLAILYITRTIYSKYEELDMQRNK